MRRLAWIALVIALAACASKPDAAAPRLDTAWWSEGAPAETTASPHPAMSLTSQYVTMRDGVRLAVDVYLPAGRRDGERLPTIVTQTRYWRRIAWNPPLGGLFGPIEEIARIVEAGYALVRVDARGSGASFGTRPCPWSADEVRDGYEIAAWVVAQPWSDGTIGTAGGSYEGTAAEFLATTRHPAVKAVAPMYALFDVYTDIAFPGGIQLEWFTRVWQMGNQAMDRNQPQAAIWFARLLTPGVPPVDADRDRRLLRAAVAGHYANYHVNDEALQLTYRDDISAGGMSPDAFSPHRVADQLAAAGIPVYNYSGWFDGGYAHAAIKRFLTVRNQGSRLIVGPWDHGGDDHVRPLGKTVPARFDHLGELLRFFDRYVKGRDTGIDAEPPVHYYTMGQDAWKQAYDWPPPATAWPLYFAPDRALAPTAPPAGEDAYRVDPLAGTGDDSRWNALAYDVHVTYGNRRAPDRRLLVYQSPPLDRDAEVTGHPVVHLQVTCDAADATFFVYLEDVDPRGRVAYVTEGELRALHRRLSDESPYQTPAPYHSFLRADAWPLEVGRPAELTFDLQPTSYLFRAGHRVRIAVAGADADHFRPLIGPPPTCRFGRGAVGSRVVLPVIGPLPAFPAI